MAPDPDDGWTHGELERGVKRIEGKLDTLMLALAQDYVTLKLWELRNDTVDHRFRELGREVGDLRSELRSKRVGWPTVTSALAAVIAVAVTIVSALIGATP